MSSLSGRVAVVIGGARGIGEACVRRMLKEGAKVVIGDVNAERGAATCETLLHSHPQKVFFVQCDVTEDEQIEDVFDAAIARFGHVDICVNCAGILDEKQWKKTIAVNLTGSISITYIAHKKMGTKTGGKGGNVVLLSSTAGLIPFTPVPSYVATKHGIVGFVRSIGSAEMYRETGVRVNAICPCNIKTEFLDDVVPHPLYPQQWFKQLLKDEISVITVEQVADALMKLLLGNYNGSSMVFTKDGIQAFDEEERLGSIMGNMYGADSEK